MFFHLLATICSLFSLVYAVPISPVTRDVWVPVVLSPTNATVWVAGSTYTVTWDTTSKPSQVTNPIGQIYLRINGTTQSTPIAQGFAMASGAANVTIPSSTTPASNWILVLFGDSGDWSPPFAIAAPSS